MGSIMNINTLGIDIAKNIFQLYGADFNNKTVLEKRISQYNLASTISNIPPCVIVMEFCGGANYWTRVFKKSGHTVKLMSPQFVKPFLKTNKNDAIDAEAIVEAASRLPMNLEPIKNIEQQDIRSLHRVRTWVVKNRTALINKIRGLNLVYRKAIPLGAAKVKKCLCHVIADDENELGPASRETMHLLYIELI